MNPSYQRAVLQSAINKDHAELALMHSGHRLGPLPPCPQVTDDPVVQPQPQPEPYYDKTNSVVEVKKEETVVQPDNNNNDKLKKALMGLLASLGLLGGGYGLSSYLNKPNEKTKPAVVAPVDDKEGDWLGALRRKGDNLPPVGAADK